MINHEGSIEPLAKIRWAVYPTPMDERGLYETLEEARSVASTLGGKRSIEKVTETQRYVTDSYVIRSSTNEHPPIRRTTEVTIKGIDRMVVEEQEEPT